MHIEAVADTRARDRERFVRELLTPRRSSHDPPALCRSPDTDWCMKGRRSMRFSGQNRLGRKLLKDQCRRHQVQVPPSRILEERDVGGGSTALDTTADQVV